MSYTAEQPIQYTPDPSKLGVLSGGDVYFGVPNGNPASVPGDRIQVYLARQGLADLAIAQPVDIGPGGVWYYNGSPAQIKVLVPYCVQILNSLGVQKYYAPASGEEISKFNALDAELAARGLVTVTTVPAFADISAALADMEIGQQFSLAGHTSAGLGGGIFDVVSPDGLTANAGTIVISGGKAAVRQNSQSANILDFLTPAELADVVSGSPVIDVGPKFNLALSIAKHVSVPGYTYLVNTTVNILDNTTLECLGATIKTINDAINVISSVSKTDWSITGKLKIYGTRTVTVTPTAGNGLYIINGKRYRVENVESSYHKGIGIYLGGGIAGALRGDRGTFDCVTAFNCSVGVDVQPGAGAEYNTWISPNISGCDLGMSMAAGNNTVIGGSIVDNTNNVKLIAGPNHCHGAFVGVNINHATVWNIWVDGVTYGHDFIGCHLYGNGGGSGDIWFNNCQGITINGGHLDCSIFNYTGASSGYNYILNMYCPGGYGDVLRYDAGSNIPQELIIKGCYGQGAYQAGVSINDPHDVYVSATRVASVTQVISGLTQLVFPTVTSNGDRRRAYNISTGAITIPTLQSGQYRITANLYFTGTSITANGYAEIRLNGAALAMYPISPYSTTAASCTLALDNYFDAGDIITIHAILGGTSVVFGGATFRSVFALEKIG